MLRQRRKLKGDDGSKKKLDSKTPPGEQTTNARCSLNIFLCFKGHCPREQFLSANSYLLRTHVFRHTGMHVGIIYLILPHSCLPLVTCFAWPPTMFSRSYSTPAWQIACIVGCKGRYRCFQVLFYCLAWSLILIKLLPSHPMATIALPAQRRKGSVEDEISRWSWLCHPADYGLSGTRGVRLGLGHRICLTGLFSRSSLRPMWFCCLSKMVSWCTAQKKLFQKVAPFSRATKVSFWSSC